MRLSKNPRGRLEMVPDAASRPYLLPAEQVAFLQQFSAWPQRGRTAAHMMDLGYRTSVRHIRTADGTAKYYVPDGLESFGHVNSRPTEAAVLSVFKAATKHGAKCRPDNEHRTQATVLDIGSNEGFFGLLAASWGCRTWMFEPQPSCQAALYTALLLNGFGADVARLIPLPVSFAPMQMLVSPSTASRPSSCGR